MIGIADKIMKRIHAHDNEGWVCTPKDFLDLGSRNAVDQALFRLVQKGRLQRAGRGLYAVPKFSESLNRVVPANLDSAIEAIARRDGLRILPSGLSAAYDLHLTTAVPAKVVYLTDGHTRKLTVNRTTVWLRHASPKIMQWAGKPAAPVVLALYWLGPRVVTATQEEIVFALKGLLPDYVKLDLLQNSHSLPQWALRLALEIADDKSVVA